MPRYIAHTTLPNNSTITTTETNGVFGTEYSWGLVSISLQHESEEAAESFHFGFRDAERRRLREETFAWQDEILSVAS